MRVNHNLSAINTYRQLTDNNQMVHKSIERLSSGLRINRAGDDAAGLAISEKMRGQIRGLDQASRNAQDSISLIQTAEAALSTTHNILQRMRELAVQSGNDSSTDADRGQLQKEIIQLKAEIDRIAHTTEYNTKKLLNGSLTAAKALQGSKMESVKLDAVDWEATAGTATGGSSITERGFVQTITGTGYSVVGTNELDEKIQIVTGVNDRFKFTVNGTSGHSSGAIIAASAGSGYTRAEFASAVEAAINEQLAASGILTEHFQVKVSITADNKLQFSTKEAGVLTDLSVSSASGSGEVSALAAMGFAGYQSAISSTVNVSAGITLASGAGNNIFSVSLGGLTKDIEIDSGTIYNKSSLISAIQNELDVQFGTGHIFVEDSNADGKLELRSAVKTAVFAIASGQTAAGSGQNVFFGIANGQSGTGGIVSSGSLVTKSGTNSILGYSDGINIANGVNDQFKLSVNGGADFTITLAAKLYSSKLDLVHEINSQIGNNKDLIGKVQASLTVDNKIQFISTETGSASSVNILNPDAVDQSALGALGYGPRVSSISGSVDISSGVRFSGDTPGAAQYKLDVTLGNKTATINLLDEDNLVTNGLGASTSGVSSRDAVVKGLQAQLDKAFGIGAIQVSTKSSGTEETLRFTSVTSTNHFIMSSTVGGSGASFLLDASLDSGVGYSGQLGSTPTNVFTTGLGAVDNTLATNTNLSALADQDGNSLGLVSGNIIVFEGTQDGKAFSSTLTVDNSTTVGDLMGMMRSIDAFQGASVGLDLMNGTISVNGKVGAKYDLSNLKLSAYTSLTDNTPVGNFNRPLGHFQVLQEAQDASTDGAVIIQVGANQGTTDRIDISNMDVGSLRLTYVDVSSRFGAASALSVLDNAIDRVSDERAKLGAIQRRQENTITNLSVFSENLTASESRIRDLDMAKETMSFTKSSILTQAAEAMLAQANVQSQRVLAILG